MAKVIQLPVGGFDNNFSYIVIGNGAHSKEAVLIDPTGDKDIIEKKIHALGVRIILQIFTHIHPDHCELLDYFKSKKIPTMHPVSKKLGEFKEKEACGFLIRFIHTPGHTSECVCILIENNLFTGDTLFVKGVGNTSYGGNKLEQEETIAFLSQLDQNLIIWPGHDYGGAKSTLKEALENADLCPSEETMAKIKKKVIEYNSKSKNPF